MHVIATVKQALSVALRTGTQSAAVRGMRNTLLRTAISLLLATFALSPTSGRAAATGRGAPVEAHARRLRTARWTMAGGLLLLGASFVHKDHQTSFRYRGANPVARAVTSAHAPFVEGMLGVGITAVGIFRHVNATMKRNPKGNLSMIAQTA
jgi:hypothetical protein